MCLAGVKTLLSTLQTDHIDVEVGWGGVGWCKFDEISML